MLRAQRHPSQTKHSPLSPLPGLPAPESKNRPQPSDVILKVSLGLFEKAEHEENLVMHEERGEDGRYSENRYIHSSMHRYGGLTSK